jgi:hypothetical protein
MLESLLKWILHGSFVAWASMVGEWGIVVAIVVEGRAAIRGYRNSQIVEAIKYVEEPEIRAHRKKVYEELRAHQPVHADWWNHDAELAEAAGEVCARYNTLGFLTKEDERVREFVVRDWAQNICGNYDALRNYVADRERKTPQIFNNFTELYNEAVAARNSSTRRK